MPRRQAVLFRHFNNRGGLFKYLPHDEGENRVWAQGEDFVDSE
jgi:hypothetical protein